MTVFAKRWVRIGAMCTALTLSLTLGPVSARASIPPHATTAGAVDIYYRSTASFIVRKLAHEDGYVWSDDGCSVPKSLKVSVPALAYASRTFVGQCKQHDFAYRNFGGSMRLDPTPARRKSVDIFFYDRLKDRCRKSDIRRAHRRTICFAYARIFYAAVRAFGRL